MNDAQDLTESDETRYLPPSIVDGNILETKIGTSKQGVPYALFVVAINEVIDQRLPRPDVVDDQDELDPGDVVSVYARRDFREDKATVAENMAVLVSAKLGRKITVRDLKCPTDDNGEFDLDRARDREAMEMYLGGFNVYKANGEVKVNNEDHFEGTRVIIETECKTDKRGGGLKKFTTSKFSLPE